MFSGVRLTLTGLLVSAIAFMSGCVHSGGCGHGVGTHGHCDACDAGYGGCKCGTCRACGHGACGGGTCGCGVCGCGACGGLFGWLCSPFCQRSNAIPQTLPLGSTVRAHYQVMETNAEAADFIFHRHDFVGQTAQLTPDGRDKLLEVAVRMRSAPFPVLVERSENNADPELDHLRRHMVAQILTESGTPDANERTIVSPAYGKGYNAIQAVPTYYQYLSQGINRGLGGGYGGGPFGGGFGGGGFGSAF